MNQTPLFYAAREGKLRVMEFLYAKGCKPNHVDCYGQTPIFYAAREGHLHIIKTLVQKM